MKSKKLKNKFYFKFKKYLLKNINLIFFFTLTIKKKVIYIYLLKIHKG